jgi:hypothetical protein
MKIKYFLYGFYPMLYFYRQRTGGHMASGLKDKPRFHLPKISTETAIFLTVWIAGLILGTITAAAASNSYFLLMRMAPKSSVSIIGLAVTVLLPFLLTAFAVLADRSLWLYPICFLKVFAFAFCGYGISVAYGSAGWLVRFLFQFSDILSIPILFWFAFRYLRGRGLMWKRDLAIGCALDVWICCLDLWFVSPFLMAIT